MILKSHHSILGVAPNATKDEIKKAFRTLAHIHHPDKGGDAEKFKEISLAYTELMKKNDEMPFRWHESGTRATVTVTYTYYNPNPNFWQEQYENQATAQKAAMDNLNEMIKQSKQRQEDLKRRMRGDWSSHY